jgi:hypothetical protein
MSPCKKIKPYDNTLSRLETDITIGNLVMLLPPITFHVLYASHCQNINPIYFSSSTFSPSQRRVIVSVFRFGTAHALFSADKLKGEHLCETRIVQDKLSF